MKRQPIIFHPPLIPSLSPPPPNLLSKWTHGASNGQLKPQGTKTPKTPPHSFFFPSLSTLFHPFPQPHVTVQIPHVKDPKTHQKNSSIFLSSNPKTSTFLPTISAPRSLGLLARPTDCLAQPDSRPRHCLAKPNWLLAEANQWPSLRHNNSSTRPRQQWTDAEEVEESKELVELSDCWDDDDVVDVDEVNEVDDGCCVVSVWWRR